MHKLDKIYYIVTSDFKFSLVKTHEINNGDIVVYSIARDMTLIYYFSVKTDNSIINLSQTANDCELREAYDIAVRKVRKLKLENFLVK